MISLSDFKFYLAFASAAIFVWRSSVWVARKQIAIETFFTDANTFMSDTSATLHRIESNHLTHQERYLRSIAKAHGVDVDLVDQEGEDVGR